MNGSERNTQIFLIDTNVFVAAVKNPRKKRKTVQLIVSMIEREDIKIVGNHLLVMEMFRYAEGYESKTSMDLVGRLLGKMESVQVGKNLKRVCKDYFDTPRKADILHAATCLKADAILITNDKDFDRIREEGIIGVWSTSKAIRGLL